jgi:hypothetical protein
MVRLVQSESELLQCCCLRLRHRAARNSATWTVRLGELVVSECGEQLLIARAADAGYHLDHLHRLHDLAFCHMSLLLITLYSFLPLI